MTDEVRKTYEYLISESRESRPAAKAAIHLNELKIVAVQEQVNILQPLIYDDGKETMDMNHRFARMSHGFMTTKYRVIYSAAPTTKGPELQTVFDPPRASGAAHGTA